MKDFRSKLAVITGGGTGMGRALARQLVREGAHVALCDVSVVNMAETRRLCDDENPYSVRVSTHECDVAVEDQVTSFRDAVLSEHQTEHVDLLFNNAGIGGGGSFVLDPREEWERTFEICWSGVYQCTRAFLAALVRSEDAHLINTSSVNGFWASLGTTVPHTAYSSAKFAVKGFSEALVNDFRLNAPHVKVSVVMPGHIGTDIAVNSGLVHGRSAALQMSDDEVSDMRERMARQDPAVADASDDEIRQLAHDRAESFRDNAPMSAEEAARVILEGVREQRWRILVGHDAQVLDAAVRAHPEEAYEPTFLDRVAAEDAFDGILAESESPKT